MPVFIAALLGGFVQAMGTFVGKALISLGLGYTVFTGVDASVSWAKTVTMDRLGGLSSLGGNALQVASALNIGTCVSILFSALTARLILNGMVGGSIKRLGVK